MNARWVVAVLVAWLSVACGGPNADRSGSDASVTTGTPTTTGTASADTTSTPPRSRTTTSAPAASSSGEGNAEARVAADDPARPSGESAVPRATTSTPTTSPPTTPAPPPPPPSSPPPPPTVPVRDLPAWTGSVHAIDADLAARMTGVSWHEGCPVPLADLRLLRVDHVGFDGHRQQGQLVVHADAADAVLSAFRHMYQARFPIERVTLVDEAGGSDDAAMAANLTTAFNCRRVTGGTGWSEHSYGRAIDINPVQNPYISSRGSVLPPAGAAHVDRSVPAVGLIVEGGPAVAAFDAVGWHWGGRWRTIKDYQHFSATGR